MIRVLFLFLILALFFGAVIQGARYLNGKQALALTKITGLAILSSSLALVVMFGLVVLF